MARASSLSLGGSSRAGLLLAGILAAIAGIIVFVILQGSDDDNAVPTAGSGPLTQVLRATQDVPARTEITREMVELVRVPQTSLLPGAFSNTDVVVGRVTRIPIYKGEQLVQEKLTGKDQAADVDALSYTVPPGKRGMAIGVDKIVGAGGLIKPGDRVDVIVVMEIEHKDFLLGQEFKETRAFTLAQAVEVLAVEAKLENRIAPAEGSKTDSTEGTPIEQPDAQPDAKVVTLALSLEEAQEIFLADVKGTIRLAVRRTGENETVKLGESTALSLTDPEFQKFIQDLLRQAAARR